MSSTSKSKGKRSSANEIPSSHMSFFKICGEIMNKVGVVGFTVLALTGFIYLYATEKQKEEIIDTWLLFKSPNSNIIAISIILILGVLLIIQGTLYHKKMSLANGRIQELASEKSELQNVLVKKLLSTSKSRTK